MRGQRVQNFPELGRTQLVTENIAFALKTEDEGKLCQSLTLS